MRRTIHRPPAWVAGVASMVAARAVPGVVPLPHGPGAYTRAMPHVETSTPPGTPAPIGPYSHIARVGPSITIGGTAGVDPVTGALAGPDIETQTTRILESFRVMLAAVDSDLAHVIHINVFLLHMRDFEAMNGAYVAAMGDHRPARTVIGVAELPKPGVLLTMNLTAVSR